LPLLVLVLLAGVSVRAYGQRFNSDNWWVLPHGVALGIGTVGQRYSSMYLGYGFLPGWEVDVSAALFKKEGENTTNHYSTGAYVKRLIFENETRTGGLSVMAGVGSTPGFLQSGDVTRDLKSYWADFPLTIPFFDNRISWDIMPGVSYEEEHGSEKKAAWGFLCSTRVAIYKIIPQSAIVAEVFGVEGEAYSKPQYRAGVR
jgi:hypothetical protein